MTRYEYKLVPAPERAEKIKGTKGPERFAATLESLMNEMGADGWRYLRADTLPVEERSGLTSKQTVYRNILVFIREIAPPVESQAPVISQPAAVAEPHPQPPATSFARPPEPEALPEPNAEDDDEPHLANLFRHDRFTVSESEKPGDPRTTIRALRRDDPKT